MKRCPGPGCDAKISDELTFCSACADRWGAVTVQTPEGVPYRVDLYAAYGLARLGALLARHAAFDEWLTTHHLTSGAE